MENISHVNKLWQQGAYLSKKLTTIWLVIAVIVGLLSLGYAFMAYLNKINARYGSSVPGICSTCHDSSKQKFNPTGLD